MEGSGRGLGPLFRFEAQEQENANDVESQDESQGAGRRFIMPTTRFPVSVHRAVKREAARQGRTFNNLVVTTMAAAVAKRRKPAS